MTNQGPCTARTHGTANDYRHHGCRCPEARKLEMARKAKYEVARTNRDRDRPPPLSAIIPAAPAFMTNPARACAAPGINPDLFFPDRGDNPKPAQKICRKCPLRAECADWAIETGQAHGVWGGTTPPQRRLPILNRRKVRVNA
jgi:WhiB family redox-sensing transcriptional regulator